MISVFSDKTQIIWFLLFNFFVFCPLTSTGDLCYPAQYSGLFFKQNQFQCKYYMKIAKVYKVFVLQYLLSFQPNIYK